jgi:hypothetical protein
MQGVVAGVPKGWKGVDAAITKVAIDSSRFEFENDQPTAGFEPATRCLQIRIYGVRSVSIRADECRFVFGCQKFRADKYR